MTNELSDTPLNAPRPHIGRDLTTGSIPRHLVAFSLPMLAGSALQAAYSLVNAIWVGQFLGKTALAAVTVSFPVVFVLIGIGVGLTMATNIQIAQYWGAREMAAVRRVVHSSCVLVAVAGLLLTAMGEIWAPAILRAMDTPADVLDIAVHYMRISLLSLPLGFGLFLVRSMLQGTGDSTTPLYFQAAAVVLNAALDPVLMFGWLGAPELGLNGTAWATVIAQTLALVALIVTLRRQKNPVAPAFGPDGFDTRTAWTTLRIGVPTAIQQAFVSISMVVVTGIVNGYGEDATAAFGACIRVDQIAFLPAMTFSMAIATLAGQNIGANRYDRIKDVLRWGCLLSGGVTVAVSLIVVSMPQLLLRIFTDDAAVIHLGAQYLRIVGTAYVFFALMFVTNGIINGAGHTIITTTITLVSLWIIRVPLAVTLSHWMDGIEGVWYAMGLSLGVSMLLSFAYYLTGRWRRSVIPRRQTAGT